ncbi:DUF3871 family protein [Alistipes shahii]|uniref:DUF3871 family protein n=3 Tax=Alistipes TaxID=239759 RepID=UPI00321B1769
MYPAFQPNPEFAVGLNSDNPFLDNPAAEVATTVEERPATPVVPLGVRHNRHFIEANTKPVDIAHLRADCVVPVFSKDNEVTISHQSFIETVLGAAHRMFPQEVIDAPDIVVSHIIKGRIPEAIHKPVNQLLETDKTIYYERMAFCFEIPTIYEDVAGNRLNLSIGGVRAYNHENLYSKKTVEKFKVFIGFKNLVCCNLCVSTDGFKSELRVMGVQDLFDATLRLFREYDAERHVQLMAAMQERTLTEHQFAQLIGKTRLYQYLPTAEKRQLPAMEFTDCHINAVAKAYYMDENFSRGNNPEIDLWRVYNLFTGANKSSYIDTFLDRSLNATELITGIGKAIEGDAQYRWFVE